MKDPNRPTARTVELINAHKHPPAPGSRVLALQHGGVLVFVEWKTDSIKYFDAWMPYPKVPADVRQIQAERLAR